MPTKAVGQTTMRESNDYPVLTAVPQPAAHLPHAPAHQLFPTRTMAEIFRAQKAE